MKKYIVLLMIFFITGCGKKENNNLKELNRNINISDLTGCYKLNKTYVFGDEQLEKTIDDNNVKIIIDKNSVEGCFKTKEASDYTCETHDLEIVNNMIIMANNPGNVFIFHEYSNVVYNGENNGDNLILYSIDEKNKEYFDFYSKVSCD